jgi:superoxide dismutase, Cu-Zn family
MTMLRALATTSCVFLIATGAALGQKIMTVDINRISDTGIGEKIGSVLVSEAKGGLSFKIAVPGLPKGQHGFHIHEKGDCGPAMKDGKMTAGIAAGDHFDPDATKSHKGPQAAGHKGDLPALAATVKGINQTVAAPRLKLSDVQGRSIVIHEGGDNYSDKPENGGGKGRVACGVIGK